MMERVQYGKVYADPIKINLDMESIKEVDDNYELKVHILFLKVIQMKDIRQLMIKIVVRLTT